MSLRICALHLHLEPDQAYALIEFIDQLREKLLAGYGDDIKAMLQHAATQTSRDDDDRDHVSGDDRNHHPLHHDPF